MGLNLLDRIGDWNPQLFREIKGRLKVRNLAIAVATSLLGQLLLFMSWLRQLPNEFYSVHDPYCRLRGAYNTAQQQSYKLQQQYHQQQLQFSHYSGTNHYNPEKIQELKGTIETLKGRMADQQQLLMNTKGNCPANQIDIQLWWHDHYPQIFTSLSLIVVFSLLVVGCYMLISDLAQEERRGSLNFIRLSPQSTRNLLGGKLLGVPILLYVAVVLTIPFQLWLGLNAQISLIEIFSFWAVVIASCAFFFSAALLFSLVSTWLRGFQPWFASGAVLLFLMILNHKRIEQSPADLLNLFSPSLLLPYLVNRTESDYVEFPFSQGQIQGWEWFYFPLGTMGISILFFALLNYSLCTYWIWQALTRCFRNPSTTMLSKRQSYFMVACCSVLTLGFALQSPRPSYSSQLFHNFNSLLTLTLLLFVGLVAALSPHRQSLQDWARYKHFKIRTRKQETDLSIPHPKSPTNASAVQDLIWGEKSPALLAIAINLVIYFSPVVGWILLWPVNAERKLEALSGVVLVLNVILIYAAITQLMLLMKTPKRTLWAAGTVLTISFLPPFILGVLSIQPGKDLGGLWLLTAFPWHAIEFASVTLVFQALIAQWSILGFLSWQLTRQLRKAGESASKALSAECPASLISRD